MAKLSSNSRTALIILALSLLIITIAESRPVSPAGILKGKQGPVCGEVFGVRKGDTCFDIAQKFELSTPEFDSINPNLNCSALFVDQWLCVYRSA